ncbi:MAG: PRC-barrel domain-containing protein [Bradyrhizobium sp.]|nr:PRC-barrel domain-containing protein [Bradyrhizobium sp.]
MLTKILKAGVAGSLLLASAAYAAEDSTAATSDKPAAAASDKASTSASMTETSLKGDWRASKVVGLNVYNEQNENVGSINDMLMDKSGNIKAAVLSVGGFLGMGARYVAVPFDKIKFSDQPVSYSSASNSGGSSSTAPGGGGVARPASSTTTGSANNATATASKPNPWYPDHAVFDATKDQLKNMPEFKYSTE